MIYPTPTPTVSGFLFHDTRCWWYQHPGVDLYCALGEPIRAASAGVVISCRDEQDLGNTIRIRHADGSQTVYAHLARFTVRPGLRVAERRIIGLCGVTGWTTGPHLHFELHALTGPTDPLPHLAPQTATPAPDN